MLCLVHPSLGVINHSFINLDGLRELVFVSTKVKVHLVDNLHFCGPQLLSPLLEPVLYYLFDITLPILKNVVVLVVSLHAVHVNLLLMHGLIHIHQHLNFERDLLGHVFFLSHIVTLVLSKKCTLCAHSLFVQNTNKLQWPFMLRTVLHY